jgi:hypothetical protein
VGSAASGDGAGQHTVEYDVWARVGSRRRVIRRPAKCWPKEWALPVMDTVPVALTVRWTSLIACLTVCGGDRDGCAISFGSRSGSPSKPGP